MQDIVCVQHLKHQEIWCCFRKQNSEAGNQLPDRYIGLKEAKLTIDRDLRRAAHMKDPNQKFTLFP